MCITGHNVYNGQHQNVFGHHLEKKDGSGQQVDKEKKRTLCFNLRSFRLIIIMGKIIMNYFPYLIYLFKVW